MICLLNFFICCIVYLYTVDKHRVYLTSHIKGRSDYINAVFVPVCCQFCTKIFVILKCYTLSKFSTTIRHYIQHLYLKQKIQYQQMLTKCNKKYLLYLDIFNENNMHKLKHGLFLHLIHWQTRSYEVIQQKKLKFTSLHYQRFIGCVYEYGSKDVLCNY